MIISTLKLNLNFSEIFENKLHLGWTKDYFDQKKIRLIKLTHQKF